MILSDHVSKTQLLEHIARILEVPEGSLTGDEKLADLQEWNSMAMMSFIAFADEDFNKILSPRQFAGCETVDDLGKLLGVVS
jgi:acyl carrier protein